MRAGRRDLSLVVPGEASYLHLIRELVTEAAQRAGFAEPQIGEIEIAVDEACANIIEHGYGYGRGTQGTPPPAITIRLSTYEDRMEIRILDEGPRFAPASQRPVAPEDFAASERRRGIGLYIIRTFVDELRHSYRRGGGNELLLVKYR